MKVHLGLTVFPIPRRPLWAMGLAILLTGCKQPAPAPPRLALPPMPPVMPRMPAGDFVQTTNTLALQWTNAGPVEVFASSNLLTWVSLGIQTNQMIVGGEVAQFLRVRSAAGGSVTLAWDPVNLVDGYRVYQGTSTRNYTNYIDTGPKTGVTITGLVRGVTYHFAATAYDSIGLESTYSDEITFTVPVQWIPAQIFRQ